MKKLLIYSILSLLVIANLWSQTNVNIAIPNYFSQNVEFYWQNNTYTHTLPIAHKPMGVCFYKNDFFVAYKDGVGTGTGNGILWYANVSFVGGVFAASSPIVLATNQWTLDVETDADGNVYALNMDGTITKFIRNPNPPYYEFIQQATVQIPNNGEESVCCGDYALGASLYVDISSNTLWVGWKGVLVCNLNNFQASGFKIINAIAPAVYDTTPSSNINYMRTGNITKTNTGDVWVMGGGGSLSQAHIKSATVQSIINEVNEGNYTTKNLTLTTDFYTFSFFGCCSNVQSGLVFDGGNNAKMYFRSFSLGGSYRFCSFTPTTDGTMPTIVIQNLSSAPYGNGMAIIPCELIYATPMASDITINAGQSATLTASGCATSFEYEWKDGSTVVGTGNSYNTSALLSSQSYTVACKNGSCRSANKTVQVNVTPFEISSDTTICAGSSVVLSATGCGTSLVWNTGQTTTPIWVLPDQTTTYTAACTGVGELSVTVNVNPNALSVSSSVAPIAYSCGEAIFLKTGQSTILTATGCTNTVIWDNTTVSNSFVVPKPVEVQWVFARCTQTNGCQKTVVTQIANNVVRDDQFATNLNTSLIGNVFTNDTEIGGLSGFIFLTAPANSQHGSLIWDMDINGHPTGGFTYTPVAGFQGLDSFVYEIGNGIYCSPPAIVKIAVGVPCPSILYANGTENPPPYTTNKFLQASDKIIVGQLPSSMVAPLYIHSTNSNNILLRAGSSIEINKGTLIEAGAVFKAEIGGCY